MADRRRPRRPRRPRRLRHRRSRRPGWGWLAVGGAVLAALWWERKGERPSLVASKPREGFGPDSSERRSGERFVLDLPSNVEEHWVPGPEGVTLRVLDRAGMEEAGSPILFFHGLGGRAEHWAAQLSRGDERRIAVDLPGHGGSDGLDEEAWTVGRLADCGAAVLDALRIRRALVVGHSLGGAVALALAASRPARVVGVLLLDPSPDGSAIPEAQKEALVESFQADPAGELGWYFGQYLDGAIPGVREVVLEELPRVLPSALIGGVEASLEWSAEEDLSAWGGPLRLLVSPMQDQPGSLHRRYDIDGVRLDRGSHWSMMDDPDAVERHLAGFPTVG